MLPFLFPYPTWCNTYLGATANIGCVVCLLGWRWRRVFCTYVDKHYNLLEPGEVFANDGMCRCMCSRVGTYDIVPYDPTDAWLHAYIHAMSVGVTQPQSGWLSHGEC